MTPASTIPSSTNFLAKATLSRSRLRSRSTQRKRTVTGPRNSGTPWATAASRALVVSRRFMAAALKRLARSAATYSLSEGMRPSMTNTALIARRPSGYPRRPAPR